jgi:transglutaminase-like putative cysteine protease
MPRYELRHRLAFTYDDIVRESQNELRLCPENDEAQQLIAYRVEVHPSVRVLSHTDYFGTRVDTYGVREPHVAVEVIADATVETFPRPLVTVSPRLAELDDEGFIDEHLEYLSPTAHTAWNGDVSTAARRVRDMAGDDVVGVVLGLHRFVHTSLDYIPGATYIGVDVNEVLEHGHGVCQDYAHLAVALCRSIGIPARYVSGYFFARDDATGADVDGDVVEVQTHAWFEAAVPGWGWLALDPTNAQQVGVRHITVGHGRDYDDVAPIRGVYAGRGRAVTEAGVEIRRRDALVHSPGSSGQQHQASRGPVGTRQQQQVQQQQRRHR